MLPILVAWDKEGAGTPMLATLTPQEAIAQGLPKPSDCDLVVVIFWSRMGSLLPEDRVKPGAFRYLTGTEWASLDARYLSGTEWEYFDGLEAAEKHGKPKILVYRRTGKRTFDPDEPEYDEITEAPTVRAILTHIGEPSEAPPISPCRGPPEWEMLDQPADFDPVHPEPEYDFDQSVSW